MRYTECQHNDVPRGLRWDVPRRNQGQTIEVAYANASAKDRSDADDGAPYKRITNRSDMCVQYYRLEVR